MEAFSSFETADTGMQEIAMQPTFGDLLSDTELDLDSCPSPSFLEHILADDDLRFSGEVDLTPTSPEPDTCLRSEKKRRRQRGSYSSKKRKESSTDTQCDQPIKGTETPKNPTSGLVGISASQGVFHIRANIVPHLVRLPTSGIPTFENATLLPPCGDGSAVQVIQTFGSLPQSLINISVANPTVPGRPTYFLVSPQSLTPKSQIVPHSPADGAVAPPDLMVSTPVSSLSDCASRVKSPTCVPTTLPSTTASEKVPQVSHLPPTQSQTQPTPKCVEDCIQQNKSDMKDSCHVMEKDMNMDSHYVDVNLILRKILIKSGKNANKCLQKELVVLSDSERKKATVTRSQVFENNESRETQLIALLGNAGMGKSTFIQRLCLDWSSGDLPQFQFVFLLNCKTLNLPQSSYSLQSLLFDLSTSPHCENSEAVFKYMLSIPREVLIIVDAFDDLKDYEGLLHSPATSNIEDNYSIKQLFSGLFQKNILSGCTVLIATRPKGVLNQLLRKVDRILELCGFLPKEIELYTTKYFKDISHRDRALKKMKKQRYIFSLCSNPLLCRSTCFLLENLDSSRYTLPSTLTGLCQRVLHQQLEPTGTKQKPVKDQQKRHISQLGGMAWDGFKGNNSLLTHKQLSSTELRDFGLDSGILASHPVSAGNGEDQNSYSFAHLLVQNLLGAVHLVQSKDVSDRMLVTQMTQPQRRKRPRGEWLDMMQKFTMGLLFQRKAPRESILDSAADTQAKRKAIEAHLESLKPCELLPGRLLELCHCVYETSNSKLSKHLVGNLPDVLSFCGAQLSPPGVYVVWHLLQNAEALKRTFSINLQDTSIPISGLRELVGMNCVESFQASIADTISLWEDLQQSNDEVLLKSAVDKFTINPFKATQVRHIDNLVLLVQIHKERKLPWSNSAPLLEEDIPAVRHLQKLEYELGPLNGPVVFPKLVEILPALQCLQHLDLENNKIGDTGAEMLADVLLTLSSLKMLNISQNCIGDKGVEKLAPALSALPSLHSLSLYSNLIADSGAENLASVLPEMKPLLDLDVKYNKFTDVGALKLSNRLKSCPWMKTLGMWNQCIPPGVFEHLQQQDSRIRSH